MVSKINRFCNNKRCIGGDSKVRALQYPENFGGSARNHSSSSTLTALLGAFGADTTGAAPAQRCCQKRNFAATCMIRGSRAQDGPKLPCRAALRRRISREREDRCNDTQGDGLKSFLTQAPPALPEFSASRALAVSLDENTASKIRIFWPTVRRDIPLRHRVAIFFPMRPASL